MWKLCIGLLLASVYGMQAELTFLQTLTYDDVPEKCVTSINTEPFVKIGNGYYLIEAQKNLNFFDAMDLCKSYGAELVSFETEAELDAVSKHLIETGVKDKWIWTSLNDLGKEGVFKYMSTGEPMSFHRFTPGQPDGAFGGEDCVHLWPQDGTYAMNDLRCVAEIHYICELQQPKTITYTTW